MEREEALAAAEDAAKDAAEKGSLIDLQGDGRMNNYIDNFGADEMMGIGRKNDRFRDTYDGYQDWSGHEQRWDHHYPRTPSPGYRDHYYNSYDGGVDQMAPHPQVAPAQRRDYSWSHANTVPQTHRGGRRLPQTPKTPSTLPVHMQTHAGMNGKIPFDFGAIDPRSDFK